MITLPVPVAVVVGACHLAVAAALAVAGAPWVVVFVVAAAATAALFAQRSRFYGQLDHLGGQRLAQFAAQHLMTRLPHHDAHVLQRAADP